MSGALNLAMAEADRELLEEANRAAREARKVRQQSALARVLVSAQQNDHGNAERLAAAFGNRVRYCIDRACWYVWTGARWEPDPGPLVAGLMVRTARKTWDFAWEIDDPAQKKRLAAHALRSGNSPRIAGAVSLARSVPRLQMTAGDLDADPMLLNTPAGLVDLRTGEFGRHHRRSFCTKLTGVPFDPTATCPRWERFLSEIMQDDPQLVAFLQRAVGYALTGSVVEQVLFFLWGAGANGKTVFLETLRYVFGDYAKTAPMSLWLSDRSERPHGATPDLASLQGARFVTSQESDAERRLNEGLVKGISGGDRVAARELYGRSFEFTFTGKLFCASNHRPVIRGTDEGIWRRFLLVPFNRTFASEERDKHLFEKLQTEGPGILRWAVEGCLAWQRDGLNPPKAVLAACQDYRQEQDIVGAWIAERCTVDPSLACPTKSLHEDFNEWGRDYGHEQMTLSAFGRALSDRNFVAGRDRRERFRRGLALADRAAQTEINPSPVTGAVTGDGL